MAAYQLSFAKRHAYSPADEAVIVPVVLRTPGGTLKLFAKIDTGAVHCFFSRELAQELSIDVESGWRERFGTVVGSFFAYGHEVTIEVLGVEFLTTVYFYEDAAPKRNVLGRRGWLDRIRLGLIDHDSTLYFSVYDDGNAGLLAGPKE